MIPFDAYLLYFIPLIIIGIVFVILAIIIGKGGDQ